MSRPQQVAFFQTMREAVDLEAKCLAQAKSVGQVCDKWAYIIVAAEGFGVPVKDRVLPTMNVSEVARVVDWTPPAIIRGANGVLPV